MRVSGRRGEVETQPPKRMGAKSNVGRMSDRAKIRNDMKLLSQFARSEAMPLHLEFLDRMRCNDYGPRHA